MNQPTQTGLVYHDIYLQHQTGADHPESPQRLKAIIERLKQNGLFEQMLLLPDLPDAADWLTTVHDTEYIERARDSYAIGARFLDCMDVPISAKSYESAIKAVSGVLAAIDAVMNAKVKNAFCAIRPPGHHARKDEAMGFCIFNNIAIASKYIQKKYNLKKVLIVDWDVHHGNGLQETFYDDPNVLYFSTHQHPFYPGSGSEMEKGIEKGENYTINVPLSARATDDDYRKVFEEIFTPAAMEFSPDFVLISAGFDAHKDDPIGQMQVTQKGFAELTRIVKQIAQQCCNGRIVSILEGGYDLTDLANSVEEHVKVLMD